MVNLHAERVVEEFETSRSDDTTEKGSEQEELKNLKGRVVKDTIKEGLKTESRGI